MKTFLGYIGLILIGFVLYWTDIFSYLTSRWLLVFIFVVIGGIFVVAFRVLGNPFLDRSEKNDKDQ